MYGKVSPEVIDHYVSRRGAGRFDLGKPSESQRRLPEVARDVWGQIGAFGGTVAAKLAGFAILRRIFHEHVAIEHGDDQPVLRIRLGKEASCDITQNPSDPDASYNARRGNGYLLKVMESYREDEGEGKTKSVPDIITHVSVGKMTGHDPAPLATFVEGFYMGGKFGLLGGGSSPKQAGDD